MIGDVLKRTRIIYGYKASEMSSELGISASYLSEIENNKKQPSLELLQKYADVYGIRLSSLILLSENMDEAEKSGKGTAFIRNMMVHLIQSMSAAAVIQMKNKSPLKKYDITQCALYKCRRKKRLELLLCLEPGALK